MFPIRCFTCGAPLADKWDKYKEAVDAGEEPARVLDRLGVIRYCCRRMFISHVEVFDELVEFDRLYGRVI